jgi:hypothetical protein
LAKPANRTRSAGSGLDSGQFFSFLRIAAVCGALRWFLFLRRPSFVPNPRLPGFRLRRRAPDLLASPGDAAGWQQSCTNAMRVTAGGA